MTARSHLWARLRSSRTAVVSGGVLVAIVLLAIIGPLVSPHDYLQTDFGKILSAPAIAKMQLFGTDESIRCTRCRSSFLSFC